MIIKNNLKLKINVYKSLSQCIIMFEKDLEIRKKMHKYFYIIIQDSKLKFILKKEE